MEKELFPLPIALPLEHDGHEAHLCVAATIGFVKTNLGSYKNYVRDPRFVCKNCGRAAASADNLCDPEAL